MTLQFVDFYDIVLFLLSILVTGPSFMSNIVTGTGVMIVFFYKGLTRNLRIGNTPV